MIHGYKVVKGKSGRRWAIHREFPMTKTIYVEIPGDHTGLSGDTVTFKLANGNVAHFKGPWISNPASLALDTGIGALLCPVAS